MVHATPFPIPLHAFNRTPRTGPRRSSILRGIGGRDRDWRGRATQFPSIRDIDLAAPEERQTFERCKLDHRERDANANVVALHRDLLRPSPRDAVRRAIDRGVAHIHSHR
jgi:hypothetical protein